jgi:FAD:protein FMN transferase
MPTKNYFFSIILIFILIGCSANQNKKYETQFLGMGTFYKISVYDKQFDSAVFQECENEVRKLEKLGNLFVLDSEISHINNTAINDWVKVSPEMFSILALSVKASHATKGAFDITIKPLLDFYEFKKNISKEGPPINTSQKPELLKRVGYKNILLDEKKKVIFLRNNAQIDLSGILKGYSVDKVVAVLKKHKVQKALVNGGGNIYCLGRYEKNKPWKIGLRDPGNKELIVKTVELIDQAVATSAGYENYIFRNGKKLSHIISPRTGNLVPANGAVSVITDYAVWADIWATAIFVDKNLNPDIEKYIY